MNRNIVLYALIESNTELIKERKLFRYTGFPHKGALKAYMDSIGIKYKWVYTQREFEHLSLGILEKFMED